MNEILQTRRYILLGYNTLFYFLFFLPLDHIRMVKDMGEHPSIFLFVYNIYYVDKREASLIR